MILAFIVGTLTGAMALLAGIFIFYTVRMRERIVKQILAAHVHTDVAQVEVEEARTRNWVQ